MLGIKYIILLEIVQINILRRQIINCYYILIVIFIILLLQINIKIYFILNLLFLWRILMLFFRGINIFLYCIFHEFKWSLCFQFLLNLRRSYLDYINQNFMFYQHFFSHIFLNFYLILLVFIQI